MKKLLSTILAATMVAGMSVCAFADTTPSFKNTADAEKNKDGEVNVTKPLTSDEYTFYNHFYANSVDNKEIGGGDKIYIPILKEEEDNTGVYDFVTKYSEIEDLSAKVSTSVGKNLLKDAKIVKKDKMDVTGTADKDKVYCVEVKVADYYQDGDKELEFDVQLRDKGHKEATTEDSAMNLVFTVGYEADALVATGVNGRSNVEVKKFNKDGELELKVNEDTEAVALDEINNHDVYTTYDKYGNKDEANVANKYKDYDAEITNIYMDFKGVDASYDVKASDQDALYLGFDQDIDKDIVIANPDAELDFLNFSANPTFDFTGTFTWSVEDPDVSYFLYENKDGVLAQVGKYNADDEQFVLRTRTLGNYIMSDKELVAAKEEEAKAETKPAETKPADTTTPATTAPVADKTVNTGILA